MKKFYLFLLISFSIFTINSLFAGNKDGRIYMHARLSASQVVATPAINSKAKGLVTFTLGEDSKTLTVFGVFDSLSSAINNCHLHAGTAGVSGGVVLNLLPLVKGNVISGTVTVTKAILAAINSNAIYINVHTANFTGGEMRGQVYYESDLHFASVMRGGANAVPVNTSTGSGLGSFVLNYAGTKLEYKVLVTGLTGAITLAHLHYGAAGVSGGIAYPLAYTGNTLAGTLTVSAAFLDSLYSGNVYVNIHTAANGGGEIRGQVLYTSQVAFDAFATGDNYVPAKVSSGKAIAVGWMTPELDSLNYYVLYDSITPNNAHFHAGAQGVNGGVIVPITAVAGTKFYSGRAPIQPDTLAKILRGESYLNIHTPTNAGGEIRGQTFTSVREGLVANLCGKQEVPAVNGTAIGAGLLTIDRNKTDAHVEVVSNGLTTNATLGHIHIGAKGVGNGGIYVDLRITGGSTGNAVSGFFTIARTTLADTLVSGLSYFNLHTTANPNGEIRGQIAKDLQSECLTTGTFEVNGEQMTVKVYPNPLHDAMTVDFNSNAAFDAQVVVSDLLGRSMLSKKADILRGANQINVSVNNLPSGVYFVQLKSNNRILFTEKVIKE
jgi:hypothetical protein